MTGTMNGTGKLVLERCAKDRGNKRDPRVAEAIGSAFR